VSDIPIIGGAGAAGRAKKEMEDAADDAKILLTESPILKHLFQVDVIARQLFLMVRHGISIELRNGWEVTNPEMVEKVLGVSAEGYAAKHNITASELRKQVLESVLPVVDIFCQMEREALRKAAEEPQEEDVPEDG